MKGEINEDEISLRDVVEIIKKKKVYIIFITLLVTLFAAIYIFLLTSPKYQSVAIASVSPPKIKANLEDKIELQPIMDISPELIKSLANSQPVLQKVAREIEENSNALPKEWQSLNAIELADRLPGLLNISTTNTSKSNPSNQVVWFKVISENPEFSVQLANSWASVTVDSINKLSVAHTEANIKALRENLSSAKQDYLKAQVAWQEWNAATPIEQWESEIASRIKMQTSLTLEIESLTKIIKQAEAKLAETKKALAQEANTALVDSSIIDSELANKSLADAREILSRRVDAAAEAYKQASSALANYKSSTPIDTWSEELAQWRKKVATVQLRREGIKAEIAKLEASLAAIEKQLAKTPATLTLQKEVTSDPVVTLAAGDDIKALEGLTLQSQQVNTVYTNLEIVRNKTLSDLKQLRAEQDALEKELTAIQTNIDILSKNLYIAKQKLEELEIHVTITKDQFSRLKTLQTMYSSGSPNLKLEPSSAQYRKLKSSVVEQEINLAELRARYQNLQDLLAVNQSKIDELQPKLAVARVEQDRLKRELDSSREAYWALKQKETDLQIELAGMQNGVAQVIYPAYPSYKPVYPQKALFLALAAFLGLFLGLLTAFVSAALEPPPGQSANQAN